MERGYARLTVYFEDPFWVGLYERESGGAYEACRIVFGPEPRDQEVYDLLSREWHRLRFSPSLAAAEQAERRVSPKRRQREIARQLAAPGTGTKAQQALALQHQQGKEARKRRSRAEREAEAARQFALRREKRREKHKGH